jgi:hypothetical protein
MEEGSSEARELAVAMALDAYAVDRARGRGVRASKW